jgi:hypothetical protein
MMPPLLQVEDSDSLSADDDVSMAEENITEEIQKRFEAFEVRAESTTKGYDLGVQLFNIFVAVQPGARAIAEYKQGDFNDPVNVTMFKRDLSCFVSFLSTRKTKNGTHYKPGTQVQYLSNVKSKMASMFPDQAWLQHGHPDSAWFAHLYYGLKRRSKAAAIKRGEATEEKAPSIRHDQLRLIVEALTKENTVDAVTEGAKLVLQRSGVGRASEVATLNVDNMHWCSTENVLWCGWGNAKTSNYQELCFISTVPEYGWAINPYHALARHTLLQGARIHADEFHPTQPTFVFSDLAELLNEKSISTKLSNSIKSVAGAVPGITADDSSHGIRIGADDDMAFNPKCPIVAIALIGGYSLQHELTVLSYLTRNLHVATAAKALSGWAECRQKVSAPILEAVAVGGDAQALEEVQTLSRHLFIHSPPALKDDGHLVAFRDVMTATLLKDFVAVEKAMGPNHCLILKIVQVAQECVGIGRVRLRELGSRISNQFRTENAKNLALMDSDSQNLHFIISELTTTCGHLQERIQALEQRIENNEEKRNKQALEMKVFFGDKFELLQKCVDTLLANSPTQKTVTQHARHSDNMLDVDDESVQVLERMPPRHVKVIDSQQKRNVSDVLMAAHNNSTVSQLSRTVAASAGGSHPTPPMRARQILNNWPMQYPRMQAMDHCRLLQMDEGLIRALALCEFLTDIIEYKINLATENALGFGKPRQLKSKLHNLVKFFIYRIGTQNQQHLLHMTDCGRFPAGSDERVCQRRVLEQTIQAICKTGLDNLKSSFEGWNKTWSKKNSSPTMQVKTASNLLETYIKEMRRSGQVPF